MTRGFLYEVGEGDRVRQYVIEQDRVLIGRGSDCDVQLRDATVSRHQAVITALGRCRIADLGGANITTLNGVPVGREPKLLTDGDIIVLGACSLRYSAPIVGASATELFSVAQTVELQTAVFTGTLGPAILAAPAHSINGDAGADAAVSVVLSRSEEPTLLISERGRTQVFPLRGTSLTIGRGARCEIRLNDPKASREHARVEVAGENFVLRDLDSANGTHVNGVRTQECRLAEDDTIRIGEAALVLRLGARPSGRDEMRPMNTGRHAPVVLVPGICGTELFKGATRLWPNLLRLISCSEEHLTDYWGELIVGRVTRETVVIPGLVKMEAFGRLIDFLCQELGYTEGVDLLEFGYDWRQDNRTSAALLEKRVASWRRSLPDPLTKIVFIAHSMGGLICRYYLEQFGGVDACARLILLGTPNRGSTRILSTAISGRRALAVPIGAARIRRMMLNFETTYQLLPTDPTIRLEDGEIFRPFSDDGWLPVECRRHLPTGCAFRERLAATERNSVPTTCVFGYGQRTLVEIRVRRERDGGFKILEESFDEVGDDAVTESSAVLDRAEIHPVRQRHGALYGDKDVQRRLRYELLERPR